MFDLSTTYLGFKLQHPLIAGASPLSADFDSVRRLEDAGAAAIVLPSLFEEQIEADEAGRAEHLDAHEGAHAEATSYFPLADDFALGPERYLEHLHRVSEAVRVPVIASLNGTSAEGWLRYAKLMEDAGADGIVVFNRFYQPDIDPEQLIVLPQLHLSSSSELLLRLHWLAILSGRIRASLACTGGVHTAVDAIKAVMTGAHAVQMVAALLINGPAHMTRMRADLERWLVEHEYDSLEQARGSMSLLRSPDPEAFERGNYMKILQTWKAK